MSSDFVAFILTHGRPNKVVTHKSLRRSGFTGRIYLVVDDEDPTLPEYRAVYGDEVFVFSKAEVAKSFDEADNFGSRKTVVYARNACFSIAEKVGAKRFVQFDDDYTGFYFRRDRNLEYVCVPIRSEMDSVLDAMSEFLDATGALTVCMTQGGDHIGGNFYADGTSPLRLVRKAMNAFVCRTDRPFKFIGRINEDVNTYALGNHQGRLFFSLKHIQLIQLQTQSNSGGMTDTYLEAGTYIKSFYSVMVCPSAVRIGELFDPRSPHRRIHHRINWHNVAPKILSENWRKP